MDTNNEIEMSRSAFFKANLADQIQTLREEIMVLGLERKWIPELVKFYKSENRVYSGYDDSERIEQLNEIIAHFITNLCGQGHYWLRRFCLDHWKLLSNVGSYDIRQLDQIAARMSGVKVGPEDIVEERTESFLNKLFGYYDYNKKYLDNINTALNYNVGREVMSMGEGKELAKMHAQKINVVWGSLYCTVSICSDDKKLEHIVAKMGGERVLYGGSSSSKTIYDLDTNIGLSINAKGEWKVFLIKFDGDSELGVECMCANLTDLSNPDDKEIGYERITNARKETKQKKKIRRVRKQYYQSTWLDGTCDNCDYESYSCSTDEEYYVKKEVTKYSTHLSSYGELPVFLNGITEYIAKKYLNVYDNSYDDDSSDSSDY